jgi:DNA-binding NarL/FixJ family response regulator
LAFRASLEELRAQRIDDFIPPDQLAALNEIWARLIATGEVVGADAVSFDGRSLHVTYFALADVLPGRHLIMFVPSDWQEWEFVDAPPPVSPLTPRELEILQLAANGVSAPRIAEELFVGTVTVNTHFANIYAKLGVHDRAAAVARGIRLGLIS